MAGAFRIQADYDELANIANQFSQEAAGVEQLTNRIRNLVSQAEGGGWIGRGAQAFFAEMNDLVFPGLTRLSQALEDASRAVNQISQILSQAEQDASSLFGRR